MSGTISIVGAGVIGRAHARAAAKLQNSVELAVTDLSADAVKTFVQEFPLARVFTSLDALLAPSPGTNDIVVVATPPFAHMNVTVRALQSGRHVLCEKPLALSLTEAEAMLHAARLSQRRLGCCSTRFLGLPAQDRVRELLDGGSLGDVHHLTFVNRARRSRSGIEYQPASRWFLKRSNNGGGVLMDWGPYDIACLVNSFRPERIEVCHAWMARPLTAADPADFTSDTEQHVGASLVMHRGGCMPVNVTYERSACTHGEEYARVEFEGTTGAVRWDWLGGEGRVMHSSDKNGLVHTTTSLHPDSSGLGAHDKPLGFFYASVFQYLPTPALVNEYALFNFAVIRAIYDACAGGRPTRVNLSDFLGSPREE